LKKIIFILILYFNSSCVYILSRKKDVIPQDYQKIYVETTIDLSGSNLSFEFLGLEVQRYLIQRIPRLKLSSQSKADIFLRILLNKSSTLQSNTNISKEQTEFSGYVTPSSNKPKHINAYKDLKKASKYATRENIILSLEVEIWDLRNQKKLQKNIYNYTEGYNIFQDNHNINNLFIHSIEKKEEIIKKISKTFAVDVVKNLNIAFANMK